MKKIVVACDILLLVTTSASIYAMEEPKKGWNKPKKETATVLREKEYPLLSVTPKGSGKEESTPKPAPIKEFASLQEEIEAFGLYTNKEEQLLHLKQAAYIAATFKRKCFKNQKKVNELITPIWKSVSQEDRKKIKGELLGIADDISDSEDTLTNYEIIRAAGHKKIALNSTHKPHIKTNQEATAKKLSVTEQEILRLQEELTKAKTQQRKLLSTKKQEEEQERLTELAIDYLTEKQKFLFEATKASIKEKNNANDKLNQELNKLEASFYQEKDDKKRTEELEAINTTKNIIEKNERELQKLETTKTKMEKRIGSTTYTWSDYPPLNFLLSTEE